MDDSLTATRIVMTAAHAGWDSGAVPVGGGAAVCERLCEAWRGRDDVHVTLLGSGPRAPDGIAYHRLAPPHDDVPPTRLSELQYARFCRRFERACTDMILERTDKPVVIAHDISEGPSFVRLRENGVPIVLVVHVDVVEYFARMYLHGFVAPECAVRLFARLRPCPVVPDVLRLVFDKQWDAVHLTTHIVVPSHGMQAVLARCYPAVPTSRCTVVGWGTPDGAPLDADRQREILRRECGVQPGERVILAMSRISPEKGQDRLLEAIRHAEKTGATEPGLRVVICGAPAFMQGEKFMRRLQRLASGLRTPVVFAGHLDGVRKRAALELADVFVAASRHESYGLTTMEACAAGLPVVAVDTHGARATVDDTCGRVIPQRPRLAKRLWLEIESLLRDDVLRRRLSEGALCRARRERFTFAANRLLELARAALGSDTVPTPRQQ